jgi:hypothetical protein
VGVFLWGREEERGWLVALRKVLPQRRAGSASLMAGSEVDEGSHLRHPGVVNPGDPRYPAPSIRACWSPWVGRGCEQLLRRTRSRT